MSGTEFLRYVGPADVHDAIVVSVHRCEDYADVVLRSDAGRLFTIRFTGVREVRGNEPVGIMVYSLSELKEDAPRRRFAFPNWDEEDKRSLEIVASDFTIFSEPPPTAD
jgi:hypothetical protein